MSIQMSIEYSNADVNYIKSKIALSKTLLTPDVLTSQFSSFVAKFVYSIWHSVPFKSTIVNNHKALPFFVKFTHQVLKASSLPFAVVLLSLKYMHNLKSKNPRLSGAPGSECRLLVCALMLAMKQLCDNTYSNRSWEKISGIPLNEINQTEMEFLLQMDFDLLLPVNEYFKWVETIEKSVTLYRKMQAHTFGVNITNIPEKVNKPITPVSPVYNFHYQEQDHRKVRERIPSFQEI